MSTLIGSPLCCDLKTPVYNFFLALETHPLGNNGYLGHQSSIISGHDQYDLFLQIQNHIPFIFLVFSLNLTTC